MAKSRRADEAPANVGLMGIGVVLLLSLGCGAGESNQREIVPESSSPEPRPPQKPPRAIELAEGQGPGDEQEVVARLFDGQLLLYRGSKLLSVPVSIPGVGLRKGDRSYRWLHMRSSEDEGDLRGFGEGWVSYAQRGELVVGVLDWMTGDSGHACRLVYSEDRGASWYQAAVIKKPHYMAFCERLELIDAQRWRLGIHLEDCADCGVKLGRYVHESWDRGRSWKLTSRP